MKSHQISIIAAIANNRVIGIDNSLPWNMPEDLKHFKETTTGHPVIMGRNTLLSIGKSLPNRTNIVITKETEPGLEQENLVITHSPDEALQKAKSSPGSEEIFIIGGMSIYNQMIDKADKLYLTLIDKTFEGDAFFPKYSDKFKETKREDFNGFSFVELEKKD